MLDEVQAAWRALPHELRLRVTIACLPMHDIEENAAIVNALQRHADVIVKKSLEEGFGLGVTEALWKRRAVVASDVGGHRDQIQHEHSGLLVDPADLRSFGNAIAELLANPAEPERLATPDTTSSSGTSCTAGSSPNGTNCSPPSPRRTSDAQSPPTENSKASGLPSLADAPA